MVKLEHALVFALVLIRCTSCWSSEHLSKLKFDRILVRFDDIGRYARHLLRTKCYKAQEFQMLAMKEGIRMVNTIDDLLLADEDLKSNDPPATHDDAGSRFVIPLIVDIVPIGFESHMLHSMDDLWLQGLSHFVDIQARINQESKRIGSDAPRYKVIYRVRQFSVRAKKLLQAEMIKICVPFDPLNIHESDCYIHVAEMERAFGTIARLEVWNEANVASYAIFILNDMRSNETLFRLPTYGYRKQYISRHMRPVTEKLARLVFLGESDPLLESNNYEILRGDPMIHLQNGSNVIDVTMLTRIETEAPLLLFEDEFAPEMRNDISTRIMLCTTSICDAVCNLRVLALPSTTRGDAEESSDGDEPKYLPEFFFFGHRYGWIDLSATTDRGAAFDRKNGPSVSHMESLKSSSAEWPDAEDGSIDFKTIYSSLAKGTSVIRSYYNLLSDLSRQTGCLSVQGELAGLFEKVVDVNMIPSVFGTATDGLRRLVEIGNNACAHVLSRHLLIKSYLLMEDEFFSDLSEEIQKVASKIELDVELKLLSESKSELQILLLELSRSRFTHGAKRPDSHPLDMNSEFPSVESSLRIQYFLGEIADLILKLTRDLISPSLNLLSYIGESGSDTSVSDVYYSSTRLLKHSRNQKQFALALSSLEPSSLCELSRGYIETSTKESQKNVSVIQSYLSNVKGKKDIFENSLPLYIPARIEIVIYVVAVQKSYEPLGIHAFDIKFATLELRKLNIVGYQELVVRTRRIDIENELILTQALLGCLQYSSSKSWIGINGKGVYMDPQCLWNEVDVTQPDERRRDILSNSQKLSVFLFSVDFPVPLYLSEKLDVAVSVGTGVIIVQNSQLRISSGTQCASSHYINGRNPVAPFLHQMAVRIIGLNGVPSTLDSQADCADTPIFLKYGFSWPTFLLFEVYAYRRNMLIRSLAASMKLLQLKFEIALISSKEWADNLKTEMAVDARDALLAQYRKRFLDFVPLEILDRRHELMRQISKQSWKNAAVQANYLLRLVLELDSDIFDLDLRYEDRNRWKRDINKKGDNSLSSPNTKSGLNGSFEIFLQPILVALLVHAILIVLFGTQSRLYSYLF